MKIRELRKILFKEIIKSSNIYIIGHNNLDLDAIGAIVGINLIVNKLNKKASVIIDDENLESGVEKALEKVQLNIIKSSSAINYKNSLLIILDTNKDNLISISNLSMFSNIFVIDHHDDNKNTIKAQYKYIDKNISSTCEIITELVRMFLVKMTKEEATILLSGIVLDTNNFMLKVSARTFYNAHYLINKKASAIEVQYLLKQDLKQFVLRQKILTNLDIINEKIAIAYGDSSILYRREDLAKVAETLLLFNGIETSFVLGMLEKNIVGISGRTLGKKNIGKILSNFNGGGNEVEGAAMVSSKNIKEVKKEIIDYLDK